MRSRAFVMNLRPESGEKPGFGVVFNFSLGNFYDTMIQN
jgi:hypothetical protein